MVNKLKLRQPLRIDGKDVYELDYDTDAITLDLLVEAEALKAKKVGGDVMSVAEVDNNYHLYVGMAAVVVATQKCTFEDLSRVQGYDLMQLRTIGRNFTLGLDAKLTQDDLDEQSETTPESTTLQ